MIGATGGFKMDRWRSRLALIVNARIHIRQQSFAVTQRSTSASIIAVWW
jgi:hypothetical protein